MSTATAATAGIYGLMAEFDDANALADATKRAYADGYRKMDAYSPFPIEPVWEAMHVHDRPVSFFVLCGGIVGMGETLAQRAEFAVQLAALEPDEVPLNFLIPNPGTPFAHLEVPQGADALMTVAAFRLALPRTVLRFAGGRELTLGDLGAEQGMLGGVNAIIVGNYLTTLGRDPEEDLNLLAELRMPIRELAKTL